MACCEEAQVLRTFACAATRRHALHRLVRGYEAGRRAATDVVDGLDACLAQNQVGDACAAYAEAVVAVQPVPHVLRRWARKL